MKRALFYLSIIFLCNEFGMAQSGSDAGSTPASFEVSASGAATYTIPFALPPGIKDIVPPVALSYSSQGGNGIAGWGWNISGLSTITRMPSSQYHDGEIHPVNFSATDRFALDGQRLMLKSGTYGAPDSEYQTENYSNLKIKAYGTSRYGANYGPAYFLVFYPDGSRAWYGSEWASNNRLEWSIYKWQDAQGNYMLYDYTNTGNLLRLESITYGSRSGTSAPNEIRFYYSSRPRPEELYVGGIPFTRKDLLESVEIISNSKLFRKYKLDYNNSPNLAYSRLLKVTEFNSIGESRPPIEFIYGQTTNGITKIANLTGVASKISMETDRMVSGDFDGDGFMDFITHEKVNPSKLYLFRNLKVGGSLHKRELDVTDFKDAFSTTILDQDFKMWSPQAITTVSETFYNTNTYSTVTFSTYRINKNGNITPEYTREWKPTAYVYQNYCYDNTRKAVPKEYITGDFNGDGLSDVLAINKAYTNRYCRPTSSGGGGGQPRLDGSQENEHGNQGNPNNSNYKDGGTTGCSCSSSTVNNGQVNFIDLDRRKETNFVQTVGFLSGGSLWKNGDRAFAADVNGDGKTELIHVSNGKILIYGLSANNSFQKLHEFSDTSLDFERPFLLGDYNGDGKADFMFPTAKNSDSWRFYISTGINFNIYSKDIGITYKENKVDITNFNGTGERDALWEYRYVAQDYNGDGKTDILVHFISTDLTVEDYFYVRERLQLYSNLLPLNTGSITFQLTSDQTNNNNGVKRFGIPISMDFGKTNNNLEYGYLDENNIHLHTFSKDHREEATLYEIKNNGVDINLEYHSLKKQQQGEPYPVYKKGNAQLYPFVDIANAAYFKIAKSATEKIQGIERHQDYRYEGAVSHLQGFGFLGFTIFRKTNWYGDNVPVIWSNINTNPQLRGAIMNEWTSESPGSQPTGSNLLYYIERTNYAYESHNFPNKVYTHLPVTSIRESSLTRIKTTESYTYDEYFNPLTVNSSVFSGLKQIQYSYFNNPLSDSENYHIGRIKQKVETQSIGSESMSTTEDYFYTNNLISQRKFKGEQTNWIAENFTYDIYGNLTGKSIIAEGVSRTESYKYDNSGRFQTDIIDVEGLSTKTVYDSFGNIISITDSYGNTTSYTYDGWNRLIAETDYLGNQAQTFYLGDQEGGMKITTLAPDGSEASELFNALGWRISTSTKALNGKWIANKYQYDVSGRVTGESEPYFETEAPTQWNYTVYDLYGRIIESRLFTGKVISTTFSHTTVTVNDGTKTIVTNTDQLGNVKTVTDPGGTITYTYHPNNELKTASYNDNVVSILIDGWGRKTELNDPSAGKYTYTYNAFGELIQETTPTGVTDYTLDTNGKTLQKKITGNETNMTINYTYDGTTKMLTAISGVDAQFGKSYQYTYSYDGYQRPVSVLENNDAAIFETRTGYDALGRAESTEYRTTYKNDNSQSNVKIRNVYSPEGILHELKDWGSGTSLWKLNSQNHRGQPLEIQLGNGYKKTRQYDPYGLPKQIRDYKPNTSQEALNLQYDFNAQRGLLNSRGNTAFNWNESFSYDTHDRLTQVSGAVNQSQQYDAMGRFTSKSDVGGYVYDQSKKYRITELDLNASGDTWFQNHSLQQVTYNAFKTPVEVIEQGHGRVSFEYNPMMGRSHAWFGGEQANKQERRYRKHYSAVSPVEIRVDTQAGTVKITTFIGGDAYTAPVALIRQFGSGAFNAYHYLHRDYLGSILAITDSSGTLREQRQFGAWGTVDKFVNNRNEPEFGHESSLINRGFTGHEHFFGVNLIHMNGRMYDAVLGRFLSPDNYVQDPYNTQSFNRYGYVWNNPLSYTDITGEWFGLDDAIAGTIGGLVNLFVNIFQGNITGSFWEVIGKGAAAFGAGFGAGVLALYGPAGWIAGGALVGGTNAWLGGHDVLDGTLMGGVGGLLGGQFGRWAGSLGGAVIQGFKVTSPLLQGFIGGTLGGGLGSGLTGFTMSLINGNSLGDAFDAGVEQAKFGFAIGAVAGTSSAYAHSKANGINPLNGKIQKYPTNSGFEGKIETTVLKKGELIDRYGSEKGKYASPAGTPFSERSLHSSSANDSYNTYQVIKPFNVQSGKVAPWFFQKGGGIQYKLPNSVNWYLKNGYLRKY
jgi:RHS repeat-associated protein